MRYYTLKEKVLLSLGLPVYLGETVEEGWIKPIPVYAFKCPIHGVVVSRVYGLEERLECPRCKLRAQYAHTEAEKT